LTHTPTGIEARCHQQREGALNRKIARKILKTKLDDFINGPVSESSLKILVAKEKARRKKQVTLKKQIKKDTKGIMEKNSVDNESEGYYGTTSDSSTNDSSTSDDEFSSDFSSDSDDDESLIESSSTTKKF
jgi:protein subunit release factor B